MYTTYKFFYSHLLIVLLCTSCAHRSSRIKKKITIPHPCFNIKKESSSNTPAVTVWVHGTRFFRRSAYTLLFENKPGMKPAITIAQTYNLRLIADTLSQANADLFPLEHFHFFGWSGKLSASERVEAAYYLAQDLKKIITDYQIQYNQYPKITIIAHSHGGNVVLNLAKIPNIEQDLHIHDLILLAVPVQGKTKHLTLAPIFSKIHVLYSTLDFIQVLAPELINDAFDAQGNVSSTYNIPPFSSRYFKPQPNLTQVCIKMNNRALMHTEFCSPHFLQFLPDILTITDTWYQQETEVFDKERLLCIYSRPRPKKIIVT